MSQIRFILPAILIALLAACASQRTGDSANVPIATEYDSTTEVFEEVGRLKPGPIGYGCANMFVSLMFVMHQAAEFCGQVTDAQAHNWTLLEAQLYRLVEATGPDPAIARNVANTRAPESKARWSSLPATERERLCRVDDNRNFIRGFNVVAAKPMTEAYLLGIESGLAEIAKRGLPADRERPEVCGAL